MPCRDYYDDHPSAYYAETINGLKKQVSFAESALCAALVALEHVDSLVETVSPKQGDFYDWLNFPEAGITKTDLVKWHKNHQELDAKHRAEEAAKAEAEKRKAEEAQRKLELRKSALKKLTAEERKALGIKK